MAMKRIPLILLIAGIFIFLVAVYYDVNFAGIPYQDPTPALEAKYANHRHIASVIYRTGQLIFIAGVVSVLGRFMINRLQNMK